jgi:hypothetical protein
MLTPAEIRFIDTGFYILDNLEKGNQVAIIDPIEGRFIALNGYELAEKIIMLLDAHHN